jgi:hypothetical protein
VLPLLPPRSSVGVVERCCEVLIAGLVANEHCLLTGRHVPVHSCRHRGLCHQHCHGTQVWDCGCAREEDSHVDLSAFVLDCGYCESWTFFVFTYHRKSLEEHPVRRRMSPS